MSPLRPYALALLSLAICASIALIALHGSRSGDGATEQAALQTSLFLLPEIERPPKHYTGKWSVLLRHMTSDMFSNRPLFCFSTYPNHPSCAHVPCLICPPLLFQCRTFTSHESHSQLACLQVHSRPRLLLGQVRDTTASNPCQVKQCNVFQVHLP